MKGKEVGSSYLTAEILLDILKDYPDGVRAEKLYLELSRRRFLVWGANLVDVLQTFIERGLIVYDKERGIVRRTTQSERLTYNMRKKAEKFVDCISEISKKLIDSGKYDLMSDFPKMIWVLRQELGNRSIAEVLWEEDYEGLEKVKKLL